jgi:hypothetical protein
VIDFFCHHLVTVRHYLLIYHIASGVRLVSFIIGYVISTLSFASPNPACVAIWRDNSAVELRAIIEGKDAIIIKDIFTNDANHNAAIVQLLLIQPNFRFQVHLDKATYESQSWTFDLLRVHLYGELVIDGVAQARGNYYPSDASIAWHNRRVRKYFDDLKIPKDDLASLAAYNKLLDHLQSATP